MLKKLENYDLILMLMAIALTCFGVVMVYSSSNIMAAKRFHDGFFFLKRQGLFAVIGFAIMLVIEVVWLVLFSIKKGPGAKRNQLKDIFLKR